MDFRGLHYPLGRWTPEAATLKEMAPGVFWLRMPLPFSLNHINLWLLDDDDAWVIVDTGLNAPDCKAQWEALFSGPLAGRPVSRIIVTHCHPDHIGLAGWLGARTGAPLLATRAEFMLARLMSAEAYDEPPAEVLRFLHSAGWKPTWIEAARARGWSSFSRMVETLPHAYHRLQEGDVLMIGGRPWRIVVGTGHSPEHACLVCEDAGVMISGDQLLPRITSNVSVYPLEPDANPLADWMASLARLKTLPEGLLVLPAHNEPFSRLRERCDQLLLDHKAKLDRLLAILAEPRTVVACFDALFGRKLQGDDLGMGTGETVAHLNYLVRNGDVQKSTTNGIDTYVAR